VRKPFGCVGADVEDVGELVVPEQIVDELGIGDRADDEGRPVRDVRLVTAAEVVERDDVVAGLDEVSSDVGADEPGPTGDKDAQLVPPRWMLPRSRRAKSKRGKDAGSLDSCSYRGD
jgi:hypothetical protein